jgi:DNA-binding beta-propeller fold protein YncE
MKKAFAGLIALCSLLALPALSHAQSAPRYKFDPDWPKLPLPNKWWMMGVTGLAVDKDDNVWVLDRPRDIDGTQKYAQLDPPTAECCVAPPAMIHFDKDGNVIGSFDPPEGHGMAVDSRGFVYIGNAVDGMNTVRKYDPKTGKVLAEVPRAPDREPGGGGGDGAPPLATQAPGGPGPVAALRNQDGGGRGGNRLDPAARAAAIAAFRAKYPPTTPMIVGQIEEVRLDESDRELYCADSYLGGRVMVFDLDTFAFKRGWGAYGHMLSEITTDSKDREYTPGGPEPREFRNHLTLNISNDGLVYAADRGANRIDVTTKQGKFVKEFTLATQTGNRGSAGGVAFSADPKQRFLFISDISNNTIWILNREDGKVLGRIGSAGDYGGQFHGLHMIATDSKGNIYTGEVQAGERVQKFMPVK